MNEQLFRATWNLLASIGACDEIDGAEFRRVLAEAIRRHKRKGFAAFIVEHANRPSCDHSRSGTKGED